MQKIIIFTTAVLNNTDRTSNQFIELIKDFWQNYQGKIFHFGKILLIILLIILSAIILSKILKKIMLKPNLKIPIIDATIQKILYNLARSSIWFVGLLITLKLIGVNSASILTIVGAATLTIGLALKDTMSNMASGLLLLILRPYKVNDHVDCGTISGTIKEIGLCTTILSGDDSSFISVPNSMIFSRPIVNHSRKITDEENLI